MIVTLSSVGGAPGVTSWAVLLAAAWPSEMDVERVVLEADPDGAVLGARFGIGIEPGASTLVSSARGAQTLTPVMEEYGRRVDEDVWLVPGPESAEAARQLWSIPSAAENVAAAAAADSRIWFVDVGRSRPNGSLAPFFERSALSLVLCRPEHDSLVQVPSRVSTLKRTAPAVGVVCVGKPSYSLDDLQPFFGSDATWTVEASPQLVDASRQVWSERRVRRSQLWRSVVSVAAAIADTVWFQRTVDASVQQGERHAG